MNIGVGENSEVSPSAPTWNYGEYSSLRAGSDPGAEGWRSWFKFDLSVIIPGATISEASLKIYAYYVGADEGYSKITYVHKSDNDNWTESEITWNNQPTYYPTATDNITVLDTGWKTWTVTNDVQQNLQEIKSFLGL